MSSYHSLVVTAQDFDRVQDAISTASGFDLDRLDSELARAQIIDQKDAPRSLITMNSKVTYEDVKSGKRQTVRLVYPRDANVSKDRISVFAPLGSALLGLREGQEIEWTMPGGVRRIKVVEVLYQPEAAGDFHL
jgi:regulator of nucleoside diphosphate kinase